MEDTPHVLVAGDGAERLAGAHSLEVCSADWFVTDRQRERWMASKGTVGAVALDADGHLAAATSTGGVRGQLPGRVGDSPLIAAGTWADDRTAAISCTGDGEAILRIALARTIAAYTATGLSVREAATSALAELRRLTGGTAGVIVIDHAEHASVQLSATMPVAWIDDTGAGDAI
jgi:beta-aspartyl-peptidase (threonine type)